MKLNNKGQTLIFFVVLIPLLLMLLAIVVDVSLMHHEKIKLENTTKTIIKNIYYNKTDSEDINEKIKDLYSKNKIDTKNVKVKVNDDYLQISNQYEIDSIFGKIIGFKKYKVKVNIKGYKKNEKIVFTKE